MIDLHIHSTASDGSVDPLDLVALVEKAGLKAFALTDHDAIDGSKEILRNKHLLGPVQFLTGVEVSVGSTEFPGINGSFHILGYGFDPEHPRLNHALQVQQAARKNRNPQIIKLLNNLGMAVSLEDVINASEPNAQIGRPHIARLMVKRGFVNTIDEAFDRYLGKDRPAYLDKPRIEAGDAIALIEAAGGIAVLAHPGLLKMANAEGYDLLMAKLVSMGLRGLEVFYTGHSSEQNVFFSDLASKYRLLVTGGSDFHGAVNPDVHLGRGLGNLAVPYALYERLADAIHRLPHRLPHRQNTADHE
ncbi:MAG: PHP domain-containing protein [Desulfosalsimonadaceae bacterium]|nr:PHP domain-containing protein [Desulfosalsimonadaceae bacterium]